MEGFNALSGDTQIGTRSWQRLFPTLCGFVREKDAGAQSLETLFGRDVDVVANYPIKDDPSAAEQGDNLENKMYRMAAYLYRSVHTIRTAGEISDDEKQVRQDQAQAELFTAHSIDLSFSVDINAPLPKLGPFEGEHELEAYNRVWLIFECLRYNLAATRLLWSYSSEILSR